MWPFVVTPTMGPQCQVRKVEVRVVGDRWASALLSDLRFIAVLNYFILDIKLQMIVEPDNL